MRQLNGSDLAGFIKQRQAHQVRGLIQAHHVQPKLVILQTHHELVSDTYVRLKKIYGADIQVEVDGRVVEQIAMLQTIQTLNADPAVHGIILQLPVMQPEQTDELLQAVALEKDVDGLRQGSPFDPATPTAVNWLLAGYNIDLRQKKIVIVGRGRLVGAPLARIFKESGLSFEVADQSTQDLGALTRTADVLVTGTGKPGLLRSDMIKPGAVVVDAGTTTESGKIVGDLADDVYQREDLSMTPKKGGVGPLTVCALFDNVITSALRSAQEQDI